MEGQGQDPDGGSRLGTGSEPQWMIRVRFHWRDRVPVEGQGQHPDGGSGLGAGSGPRWRIMVRVPGGGSEPGALHEDQVSAHVIRALERRSSWNKQSVFLNMMEKVKTNRVSFHTTAVCSGPEFRFSNNSLWAGLKGHENSGGNQTREL